MDMATAGKIADFAEGHPGPFKLYPRDRSGTLVAEEAEELMLLIADLEPGGWVGKIEASDRKSIHVTIPASGGGSAARGEDGVAAVLRELRHTITALGKANLEHTRMANASREAMNDTLKHQMELNADLQGTVTALTVSLVEAQFTAESRGGLSDLLTDPTSAAMIKDVLGSLRGGEGGPYGTLLSLKKDLLRLDKERPQDAAAVRSRLAEVIMPGVDFAALQGISAVLQGISPQKLQAALAMLSAFGEE